MEHPEPVERSTDPLFALVRDEVEASQNPLSYANKLKQDYGRTVAYTGVLRVESEYIEPCDTDGVVVDEDEQARQTFERGGLLAIRILDQKGMLRLFHYANSLAGVRPDVIDTEDTVEALTIMADSVIDYGMEGYSFSGPFNSLLEEYENHLARPAHTAYLRAGFGLMMRRAYECEMLAKLNGLPSYVSASDPDFMREIEMYLKSEDLFRSFNNDTTLGDESGDGSDGS